jgi:ABC-type amino acid transport substrate-binding protein
MLLFNEKHEQLDIKDVKAKLQNLENVPTPSLQDVQTALGDYYSQALQLQGANYQFKAALTPSVALADQAAFLPGIGGKILEELKKIICAILNGASTTSDILEAVLNALASIIPGGAFIETLAKIVVKYLLSQGVDSFCGFQPA